MDQLTKLMLLKEDVLKGRVKTDLQRASEQAKRGASPYAVKRPRAMIPDYSLAAQSGARPRFVEAAMPSNRLTDTFFGSKREKASKMYELDKITQARLSNDFARDPMRFAGKTTSDVVRSYAPNPYAAVEFTDGAESWVQNRNNTLKPILSGYYNTMAGKSAGRDVLNHADSTEAVSEYEKLADRYAYNRSDNWFIRGLQGAGNMVGQMAANYITPEAAIGTAVGGMAGFKAASAKNMAESSVGQLYLDMKRAGVDDDTARRISAVGGLAVGGLEYVQMDEIAKGFGMLKGNPVATNALANSLQKLGLGEAVEKVLGAGAGKFIQNRALPVLGSVAKNVATETAQEVGQEMMSIGAENYAKYKSGIQTDSWRDVGNRLKDTAIDSALTFGIMGTPGLVGGVAHNNITPYRPKTQNTSDLRGISESGAVSQSTVQTSKAVDLALSSGVENQRGYDPVRDGGPMEEIRDFQERNANLLSMVGERLRADVRFFEGDPNVNGHYKDGAIWLNVNSERSLEYVFGHELYHYLRDQTHNQELDKLTNFLLGEAKDLLMPQGDLNSLIQAKVEQYNSYGESLSGYQAKEELLADAVGKLLESEGAIERLVRYDQGMFQKVRYWVEDMIARFRGTPEERRFLQAQRLLERAVEKSSGVLSGENGAGAYLMDQHSDGQNAQAETSVRYDDSGNPYVMIEKNLFDGVELSQDSKTRFKQIKEIVKGYLQNEIGKAYRIYESGQLVNIDGKFQKEFTGSTHSHSMNLRNPHIYEKKMNAATQLGDLIGIATGRQWQKSNKQGQLDRYYGVYHYNTKFGIPTPNGVENYDAVLVIRNDANGKKYLYDIQGIKKSNSLHTSLTNNVSMSHQNGVALDTNSIAGQPQNVKPYLSDDPPDGMKSLGGELKMQGEGLDDPQYKVRSTYETAAYSDLVHEDVRNDIKNRINKYAEDVLYKVANRKEQTDQVKRMIAQNGADRYYSHIEGKIDSDQMLDDKEMVMGVMLVHEYSKRGDLDKVQNLVANLSLNATRHGSAAQTIALFNLQTPQGALLRLNKVLDKTNKQLKLDQQLVLPDHIMADILNAEMGSEDLKRAVKSGEAWIMSNVPATAFDKWNAWRYMSMLGNIRTMERNLIGNIAFMLPKKQKDFVAAAFESLAQRTVAPNMERTKTLKLASRETKLITRAMFDEVLPMLQGNGKEHVNVDKTVFDTAFGSKGLGRGLEAARKAIGGVLEGTDVFFLKKHFEQAFSGYLTANDVDPNAVASFHKDKDGKGFAQLKEIEDPRVRNIVNRGIEYAALEAKKATFRDPSRAASWLNGVKNSSMVGNVVLNAYMPFTQTPINILKRGVEYSPVGFVKTASQAVQMAVDKAKGRDSAVSVSDIIDSFSTSATGSTATALGYVLASAGLIVGNDHGEDDETLRELEGNQSYSLVWGDHTYTLDWLAPISMPFFMGVELYNIKEDEGTAGQSARRVLEAMGSINEPMMNLSMLKSLNDAMRETEYAEDEAKVAAFLWSGAKSYINQGIPTALGQVARTIDNKRRTKYIDKNSYLPKPFQELHNDIRAKIPFYSQTAAAYIDPYGNEVSTGDNWATRAFHNMLSPGFYKKRPNDAVTREIRSLYDHSGDKSVIPKGAVKYVKGKYGKDFTPSEYEAYNKDLGKMRYRELQTMIGSEYYKSQSKEERIKMIKKAMEYAKTLADHEHLDKPLEETKWAMNIKDSGITVTEHLAIKDGKEAYGEAAKKDRLSAVAHNPYEHLKLKGKERDAYILDDMVRDGNGSDVAKRKYKYMASVGIKDADTYYQVYKIINAENYKDGRKYQKKHKIADMMAMGFGYDQSLAIWEIIKSTKYYQ